MGDSEIRVKQIRVNQGLAVLEIDRNKRKFEKNLFNLVIEIFFF